MSDFTLTIDSLTLAALQALQLAWSVERPQEDNPFANTAAHYKGTVFEVHAYSWSDADQPFNFKWRDVEVSWYKYLGRGTHLNREVEPAEVAEMLEACMLELTSNHHVSFVPTIRAETERRTHG